MTTFSYIPSGDHQLAASIDRPAGDEAARHPVVIVVHGLTGNRIGRSYHLVDLGRRLAAQGMACVRFDQAGCGESTGDFQSLTIPRMADDIAAVHAWARAQPWADGERVGYVALSLGGLATVEAESRTGSRAVALWAPVYDMPRVFKATAKTGLRALLMWQGWVPYRGLRVGKGFIDQLAVCDAGRALANSKAPLRVYHSETDETVPLEESLSYLQRCGEIGRPCTLERFKSANHDFLELQDRERLLGDTAQFMRRHLVEA